MMSSLLDLLFFSQRYEMSYKKKLFTQKKYQFVCCSGVVIENESQKSCFLSLSFGF